MKIIKALSSAMILSMASVTSAATSEASSLEPLDSPATMSRLSSSTLLTDVVRANDRLIAAGWRGHILISDDQGLNWTQVPVPVDVDLTSLSFPTARSGWAAGHSGVLLHSTDAGQTWSKVFDGRAITMMMAKYYEARLNQGDETVRQPLADVTLAIKDGPTMPWLDVFFVDETHGYLVGPFNSIVETRDGGVNWIPIMDHIDNPDVLHLNAMAASSGTLFIASERGKIFVKMPDSDRFVQRDTGYAGSFFGIVASEGALIAYGMGGTAYRSTDLGKSWTRVETGVNRALTGATAMAGGRVALVTQGGSLLIGRAAHGGFVEQALKPGSLLASVAPINDELVAVCGLHGVARQPILAPAK